MRIASCPIVQYDEGQKLVFSIIIKKNKQEPAATTIQLIWNPQAVGRFLD